MKISSRTVPHCLTLITLGVIGVALPQSGLAQAVTVTTLVNFDGTNGASPYAALTLGRDGNFYGTTDGDPNNHALPSAYGTVFQLTPAGALTTLATFTRGSDGYFANGAEPHGLVQGSDGNLYGTTRVGGIGQGLYSEGTVFSITTAGALTTLHTFGGTLGPDGRGGQVPDGADPEAAVIQARDGNFYGTTSGTADGYGALFALSSGGAYAKLASFVTDAANDGGNGPYGQTPGAALLQGSDGNFYGTTRGSPGGIFKYTPGSGLSALVTFTGPDGLEPTAELIQGTDGNFYGTTRYGGSRPNPNAAGTVFRLTPAGVLTTLVNFDGANGNDPRAALLQGRDGNFYGTTSSGGSGYLGTVFKMTPAGVLTTIFNFPGDGSKGAYPYAALIQGTNGDFYGTTILGGSGGRGTVFRLNISPNNVPEKTLGNIATRLRVGTGDNALIGGFIVTGTQAKKVIVRGIGPSLAGFGVQGALANPTLELRDGSGMLIAANDNWKDTQQAAIEATGVAPKNDLESAIVATLPANNSAYTAILRGKDNSTGIGVVEAYDLETTVDSQLGNISSRGFVDTGDNVLFGGFIVGPNTKVGVRAIGPSLGKFGIANPLQDPTLELHDGNGALINSNDNWKSSQEAEIRAAGLAPSDDREAALIQTLAAGSYTAIVKGVGNTTGIGVVEAYKLQ